MHVGVAHILVGNPQLNTLLETMAQTLSRLTIVLSLLIITLSLHSRPAFSTDIDDDDGKKYYEVDTPLPHFMSRSRFLATAIKKGAGCSPNGNNIGNGVSANKGAQLLQCCKKKCVDVLGDMNNCGQCARKCNLRERCSSGTCTNIFHNVNNCAKCDKKCKQGILCRIGIRGYA